MRRAARRDVAEPEVVTTLRGCGFSVYPMDRPVDLLVGFRGMTHLVEVKTKGTQYGKKLNDNQAHFSEVWRGSKVVVLKTAQDAMDWAVEIANGKK